MEALIEPGTAAASLLFDAAGPFSATSGHPAQLHFVNLAGDDDEVATSMLILRKTKPYQPPPSLAKLPASKLA